jgi:radical SAM protein with 4Fe4S-binding SPASM domain
MSFNISGVCVSQEGNNEYMANPRVAIEAFEKAYLHAKSRGIKARLVTPMPLCNFNPDLLLQLKEDHAIGGSPCQLHHGKNFVLDYNGDVVPCTHLTGFPYFNILNEGKVIPASEFVQKYNSVEANQFRTKFGRYASTKCDGCKERCSGGCPLYWIKLNPDEVIKGISIPEPSTALLAGAGALGLGALGSRSRRTDAKKY